MKSDLPKILLVDDEARAVELLTRSLRKQARVVTASSGEEALALFQPDHFLLVISDQRMPGMSGVDLFGRLAAIDDATGRILLTGYADLDATVAAINRGRVHAYLHKPCSPPDLLSTVKTVSDRVRLERENQQLRAQVAAGGEPGLGAPTAAPGQVGAELLASLRDGMCELTALADGLSDLAHNENHEGLSRLAARGRTLPEALEKSLRELLGPTGAPPARVDLQEAALDDVVAEAIASASEAASLQGVLLDGRLASAAKLPMRRADMIRCFDELIQNALEAMQEGGMLLIETLCDEGHATVRFSDTGDGLAPDIAYRLCDAFVSTRARVGRGLGLSIATRVAADHAGRLEFSKAENGGTAVSLRLPVAQT